MRESDINIKKLQESISKNKLVIFAGAGISVDSDIPDWSKLIQGFKDELDIPNNDNDYLKIPQYYFNERGEKEYVEKVRAILKHNTQIYNLLHEKIFDLNPEHILTTNFDNLLEQVIESKSYPFSVIRRDKDFPYSENTKYLVKVHGDLGENDFVLKENDYLNYSINHPLIEAFLKSVFATRTVLFIGYSLNDTNLKQILHQVRNILGNDFQSAYVINNSNIETHTRNYFKAQGVNIISIKEIDDVSVKSNKRYNNLSERGKSLYKILHKISSFENDNQEINNENIVELFYENLNELNPNIIYSPDNILSLNIFTEEYVKIDYYDTLYLSNKYFNFFFEDLFTIDEKKVKIKDGLKLTKQEIKSLETKIEFILKTLNYNGFLNVKIKDKIININIIHSYDCECFNCLIDNSRFKDLIKKIDIITINESTSVKDDLQLAFAKYRIGQFLDSYYLFTQISTKAWKRKEFVYYYITKRNIKYFKNLLRWNVSDNEEIIEDINKIDLNKLIIDINELSRIDKKFIESIQDERYLNNCYNKLVEYYEELTKQYVSDNIINYDYTKVLNKTYKILKRVQRFYTRNYIVLDKYTDYIKLYKLGLNIYIFAYNKLEKNKYEDISKVFNSDILLLFLRNISFNDFEKSLLKFNILKIDVSDDNKLLEYINTIIENYDKLPTDSTLLNETKNRLLFKCFILLKFFIKDYNEKSLISLIQFYLKDYNYQDNYLIINILNSFHNSMSSNHLDELYNIFKDNNIELLENLIHIYSLKEIKLDDNKINELLYKFDSNKEFDYSPLYNVSKGNSKNKIRKIIYNQLDYKFHPLNYIIYSMEKIIDYKKYFDKYIAYINKIAATNYLSLSFNEKLYTSDRDIYNLILFILELNLKTDDFKNLTDISNLLEFYLNRENIKEKDFNIEFIRYFSHNNFIMTKILEYKNISKLVTNYVKNNKNDEDITQLYIRHII